MPNPAECKAKGLEPGSPEYQKCVNYQGQYAKKAKKPANPIKGSLKKPATGGGGY